ncbi:MAG: exonuclease SbcCD subunit D [Actinomycetota bacterium]
MRFLHTADWHVGRTIRGRSRVDEFAAALSTVVEVAEAEGVDALLLAGDIYDQRSVSPDADKLIFETLLRLGERGVGVVAIPGNHDSSLRLGAFAPLLERIGTHVVPKVRRPDEGAIVTLASRDGTEAALFACVPFTSPRRFSDAAGLFDDMASGFVNYDENMGKLLAAYEARFRADTVNIVIGHMFISGAQPGGSEREITIGSDYAISPQRLPATASYVALGHIHKAQKVPGAPGEAHYSGSLLQLDFGEVGQQKSLVVVEASAGKPARVHEVALDVGRRLVDVEATPEVLDDIAEQVDDAFLRVHLTLDRPIPGIADLVREKLPNTLDVRLVLPEIEGEPAPASLQGLSPKEQFLSYYGDTHGSQPSGELTNAFDRIYEEVTF